MNTENFKPLEGIDIDFVEKNQMEIMFRYEPSEREVFKNFDIDTYEDQEIFKKYCWRVTEEITEALEDTEHPQHFKEEIIDSFNFLVELYNLYGWSVTKLTPLDWIDERMKYLGSNKENDFILLMSCNSHILESCVMQVVKQLGLTANLLKNRKWRQSQYLVDLLVFEQRFKLVWDKFLEILAATGISKKDLLDQWSLKFQVNKFRLDSNY